MDESEIPARLTFRKNIRKLVNVLGSLLQIQFMREQACNPDQEGRCESRADMGVMHGVAKAVAVLLDQLASMTNPCRTP